MGQAKLKGNRELRVVKAIEKIEALKPEHIICNNCQAKLTEISPMNSRGLHGIEAAFAANCKACSHNTYAIKGTPEAVAAFSMAMEYEAGHELQIGVASSPKRLS